MVYRLALGSAALYGAADFMGGLASRRASTITIVVVLRFAVSGDRVPLASVISV